MQTSVYNSQRTWVISYNKAANAIMLKVYLLHTICHKSHMFRSILIALGEILYVNKAYIKTWIEY